MKPPLSTKKAESTSGIDDSDSKLQTALRIGNETVGCSSLAEIRFSLQQHGLLLSSVPTKARKRQLGTKHKYYESTELMSSCVLP